jgi:hypothetical protein
MAENTSDNNQELKASLRPINSYRDIKIEILDREYHSTSSMKIQDDRNMYSAPLFTMYGWTNGNEVALLVREANLRDGNGGVRSDGSWYYCILSVSFSVCQ